MTTQAIVCYIVQIFSAFEPRYQCYLLMLRTNNCISFTNTWAHSELFMVVAHLFSLMVLFLFLFFICLFICFCFFNCFLFNFEFNFFHSHCSRSESVQFYTLLCLYFLYRIVHCYVSGTIRCHVLLEKFCSSFT